MHFTAQGRRKGGGEIKEMELATFLGLNHQRELGISIQKPEESCGLKTL